MNSVLKEHLDNPVATPDFHNQLWNLCCSDHKKVALAAPRGHAKSTAITFCYAFATFLFRERSYGIIVSATEASAIEFLRSIKMAITNNDYVKELFGIGCIIKNNEKDCIVRMQDGHEFRIKATGSEGWIRGTTWGGKRPDIIICDDMEGDEQVESKERREKFRNWFFSALLPCLSRTGVIRLVGTILHFDSLLNRLLSDKSWYSVKFQAHNEDFSHILWPEAFPEETLRDIRQSYINQGMPEKYAQEYLNNPLDSSVAYFRKEDFKEMDEYDREKPKEYYAAIDMAISKQEKADFTAIAVCSVDQDNVLCVEHIIRGRMDGLEIIETMFAIQQRYKPQLFTVEQEKIARALGPFLDQEMMRRNVFINLNLLFPTKDKPYRARGLQARMRAGSVKFDTEASWYPELQEEMLRFPKGVHDDMVDALAWVGLTLNNMQEARTQEEIDDDEWEEEYNDCMMDLGRSLVTGY